MYSSKYSVVLLVVVILTGICAQPAPPTGTPCRQIVNKPGCVCQAPNGRIDLTPLANNNRTARFTQGLVDSKDYTYAFNPCYLFNSANGACKNVYICQTAKDGVSSYEIANANEQIWIDNEHNTPYLYYEGPNNRATRVYLNCDHSFTGEPEVTTEGDVAKQNNYIFYIKSSKVCPIVISDGDESVAGIAGIIIILLLFVALVAYFVIGMVIMKVKFQATGSDIIPNKSFWFGLPLLVKDGVIFTFGPCIFCIKNRGYSKAL